MSKELKESKEITAETYDVTKYEKPSVTVDLVVFTIQKAVLKVLLVKRKEWPFKNAYALPGGFVKIKESVREAATRELEEETGVKDIYMEQLYTFGDPKRDPRTRVITVSYLALINSDNVAIKAGTDAKEVEWFAVKELPKLGFDHNKIIEYAFERIKTKLSYSNIAFSLLPELFTLSQVQRVYEYILGHSIDKRNFRKKLNSLQIVEKTKHMKRDGAHRPASLYKLKDKAFSLQIFD